MYPVYVSCTLCECIGVLVMSCTLLLHFRNNLDINVSDDHSQRIQGKQTKIGLDVDWCVWDTQSIHSTVVLSSRNRMQDLRQGALHAGRDSHHFRASEIASDNTARVPTSSCQGLQ
jgi:hypothetical protein